MDLEERVDGTYLFGRKVRAFYDEKSDYLQVDLFLKDGDCNEARSGDDIPKCPGGCDGRYAMFIFAGNSVEVIGCLQTDDTVLTQMHLCAKYGANTPLESTELLFDPRVKKVTLFRKKQPRGIKYMLGDDMIGTQYAACTFTRWLFGAETDYGIELQAIKQNWDTIKTLAENGRTKEMLYLQGILNL